MRHDSIKGMVATVLVAGHITAIILVFTHLHAYLASTAEKLEIVLILSPLTGLFALAAVKHVMRNPEIKAASRRVSSSYAAISVGIPVVFVGFVIYAIVAYPFGIAEDPQSLRMALAAVEVALGAMLGAIVESLFDTNLKELKKEVKTSEREIL
ncbi:hypothetical protein HGO38_24460 [Rhizobium sp. CG5]|uniref:hypothetical protein n=1 Tax=Rhizobium sp. CG5 TaxID=2726076 RepID=UPI002033835B|nr:hypothetical protein [Rhizobium sp. CG5]MCM2476603.1 hypothetical protein [Rhizobium sp. CG5]